MSSSAPSIIAVDDKVANLQQLTELLASQGYRIRCASTALHAVRLAFAEPPDLFLLDIQMPVMDGYALCERIKAIQPLAEIPVIFVSARHEALDKARVFAAGGVDYITKPFHVEEVRVRVDTHVKSRRMHLELKRHHDQLQEVIREQVTAIVDEHTATIFALAKLAESRDDDTGHHIRRIQEYCRVLMLELAAHPSLASPLDELYIENVYRTAPLHDIGKVGVPDTILLKPGRLTPEEMAVMKTHTLVGARTLDEVLSTYPDSLFVRTAAKIARSHHERWDGSGYPDGLSGDSIPFCARILSIADQYDALRNARSYKPAFDHRTTCSILLEGDGRTMPEHFDPQVLAAFKSSRHKFDLVYKHFQDRVVAAS